MGGRFDPVEPIGIFVRSKRTGVAALSARQAQAISETMSGIEPIEIVWVLAPLGGLRRRRPEGTAVNSGGLMVRTIRTAFSNSLRVLGEDLFQNMYKDCSLGVRAVRALPSDPVLPAEIPIADLYSPLRRGTIPP